VSAGTDFNQNPDPIGAEEEARQMPLSFDDGGESLSLPTATRRRRPGVGAVVFGAVAVVAAGSLFSMRAIGRAGAAENAPSEAGKLVETFLKERAQAKAGAPDAKLDILDTEGVTALQIAKEDLHKDPFDRMLIAQAKTEPLLLLTNDAALPAYGDCVKLVGTHPQR